MTKLLILVAVAAPIFAQLTPEQASLQKALGEAGNSPSEFELAIENHLKQYPNSPERAQLENALVKTAMQQNDDARLIKYGESVLSREPNNTEILEHVTTALLHQGDKADAERALEHAHHFADLIENSYSGDKFQPGGGPAEVRRKEEYDRGRARALLMEARAEGLLGHTDKATEMAQSSYKIFPSVEGAREAARWLSASGKDAAALDALANAFSIGGMHSADTQSMSDRIHMGELYRKLHGTDAGLGDMILKAYDTTSAELAARREELRELDPNSQIKDPIAYTLSGLEGDKLQLHSLLGKVIVLDFWATWCGPCREQHPLYEQVKTRFKDVNDVVFLAIDTDEDHSIVKPFLEQMKWTQKIYFEDGLQSLLQVSSIPTTVILGKDGRIFTRMIGYLPDRFVDMLTDRVDEALGRPVTAAPPKPASPAPVSRPAAIRTPALHQ